MSDSESLSSAILPDNPCQQCGACCAAFRVDFHKAEAEGGGMGYAGGVPRHLAEPLIGSLLRMKGTDEHLGRCAALCGEVGQAVQCSIYEQRPSPCREFNPFAALGIADEACARARRRHGLPPLAGMAA
ncbi:YkgJ family cysteine cluster protein [Oryzomicrobium sp.]|uniref:YkgJ family cysteine cluster protein n=1 Tax=Oryzomicrobium sp. TaxID=1911578 RepID=UPI0025D13552|nr:YkgJ family cysteine cluster protein [Oryzomicrobium sp.]MCE1242399.1 YkgJ family cysteine cluster protein [Oryzomicrobium sp.]